MRGKGGANGFLHYLTQELGPEIESRAHADPARRTIAGGGCYMAGNPELEPEESTSYEVGVDFLGVTYFNTRFENKIDYAPLGYYQGLWWTRMENIEHACTSGLEATATLRSPRL